MTAARLSGGRPIETQTANFTSIDGRRHVHCRFQWEAGCKSELGSVVVDELASRRTGTFVRPLCSDELVIRITMS